ncbi:MAG: MarR family transcriptional regulator [Sphingomonas bacterium]|nr:MarR family transcriptional regulator [Sphingomonas bacterium]MDB5682677.1 MarR family transcriptional regulator [Sphingomonas bacterium]MDB5717085.1 MarR family transcriptional regulator [Sphingomonas bacterium]
MSIGFLMHDVARLMRYRFDARARDLGVTRPQWRVLLHLARTPGPTQAELADLLDVERITLCRMIDRLADAGLVERRADPSDRRVWRLHLLPAAHGIADQLAEIGAKFEEEILSPLDEQARASLMASLESMRDGLRRRTADEAQEEVA